MHASDAARLGSLRYTLQPWQREAVEAWERSAHPDFGHRHGVIEVYTGGGKTICAMACMAKAVADSPGLKFAVVVPTIPIALQWERALYSGFDLPPQSIGFRMSGRKATFSKHDCIIYVINSARRYLASDVDGYSVMLIVDECHRAGSKDNLGIFDARTAYRLGLSATASRRDDFDDIGMPVPVENQAHIRALGPICYVLDLKAARARGMLPRYAIHHHRLTLSSQDREKYDALTVTIQECKDELRSLGVPAEAYMRYCASPPPGASSSQVKAARAVQAALFRRKQWLYGVGERNNVARHILAAAVEAFSAQQHTLRALVFNERIDPWSEDAPDEILNDEGILDASAPPPPSTSDGDKTGEALDAVALGGAAELCDALKKDAREGRLRLSGGEDEIALYHSRLTSHQRDKALQGFAQGKISVLVSVKALIEGLDVPDANFGLSAASSASGRQRIQTMGRVLRAPRDRYGNPLTAEEQQSLPAKEIHLLYIGDTADQEIYVQSNWSDLTGQAENYWWRWPFGASAPTADTSPPTPPLSDVEAWAIIDTTRVPQAWPGTTRGVEWVFKKDTVMKTAKGPAAENPTEAVEILQAASQKLRMDIRGPFVVTLDQNIVLKAMRAEGSQRSAWYALGKLSVPLRVESVSHTLACDDTATSESDVSGAGQLPNDMSPLLDILRLVVAELETTGGISLETKTEFSKRAAAVSPTLQRALVSIDAIPSSRAERAPAKLLTADLLNEAFAAIGARRYDRAQECVLALEERSDTWLPPVVSILRETIAAPQATTGKMNAHSEETS
jgi:superfamily II DNA or RNA helicase